MQDGPRSDFGPVLLPALCLAAFGALLACPAPHEGAAGPGGDIHPTSLPIVDGDLATLVALTRAQIRADAAHVEVTGEGIIVAVLDGGFDLTHPALAGHLAARRFDAIDGDDDPHDPGNGKDDDRDGIADRAAGHGTFVAGMVLLAAPRATILPVRVRDDEGRGSDDALLRGLRFARSSGAHVVNLSISAAAAHPTAVLDLMDRMHAEGTTLVVSAGNDGSATLSALGRRRCALVVASVDAHDRLASFSNYAPGGAGHVLCAPGVDLPGPLVNGRHGRWSGTSFSAGLVSGAAALLRRHRPTLRGRAVYEWLAAAVDPVSVGKRRAPGLGRINLWKVVRP